jgi:hypothetical protein
MTDPTYHPHATAPSLSQPWVLIRNGKAPPILARITRERWDETFYGELMVVELDQIFGRLEWRKRREDEVIINSYGSEILHVFPDKPGPIDVAEARRALRRKQQAATSAPEEGVVP